MEIEKEREREQESIITRESLLQITSELLHILLQKTRSGRFRAPQEVERMRDAKTKLLLEAIRVHGAILRDSELNEIRERLLALEERLGGYSVRP